jgi:hypothetical protein
VQYVNGIAYKPDCANQLNEHDAVLRRWIKPHPLVDLCDTLHGAANITEDLERVAIKAAEHKREEVRQRAEARRAKMRADELDATQGREAALRLQLVMAKLPWHTTAALEGFSSYMLRAIGHSEFIINNTGTPLAVVRKAAYIGDVLNTGLKRTTVDFFLNNSLVAAPHGNWTLGGVAWNAHAKVLRGIAKIVDRFTKKRFTLKCVQTRKLRTEVYHTDDTGGGLPLQMCENWKTSFIVTTQWPGVREEVHTCRTTISDAKLYKMRATSGLDDEVDLEEAIRVASTWQPHDPTSRLSLIEDAATNILSAALATEHRSNVLQTLALPQVLHNIVDNNDLVDDGM